VAAPRRSTVFGLDVYADTPLPYLDGAGAAATGRRFDLRLRGGDRTEAWDRGAERISDERDRSGQVVFQIEAGRRGYRIVGPEYGETVIDATGTGGSGRLGQAEVERWQRLLIAQALPFAAVLRGLEAFHASGVVLGGRAVLLAGASGSGKSSLALALRRRGAEFLADDVVAVGADGEGDGAVLAHPGPPVAALDTAEVARLRSAQSGDEGPILGRSSRETMIAVATLAEATRLGAVFVLERRTEPIVPTFEPLADARPLLASTFNLLLRDPGRLARLLDLCALISRGRCERLAFGSATEPEELAQLVEARVAGG
jgi:hypothetical protein